MTEYPVQCFGHNGEPYGRYCNPHGEYPPYIKPWHEFEKYAKENTFPMLGAEIGKTYEREEIEVVWQIKNGYYKEWENMEGVKNPDPSTFAAAGYETRQIFRLTQPVEKEPETVEQAAKRYTEKQPVVKMALYRAFIAGANWQKQQSK